MRVVKLVVYNGEPDWIKQTLDKSIKGTLYTGKNLIQTIVLEEPSEGEQGKLGARFICTNCAEKFDIFYMNYKENLRLCPGCMQKLFPTKEAPK